MSKNSIFVYVDGFNLYRRTLAGSNFKWLNLDLMACLTLKVERVERIYFFTANIKPIPHDPLVSVRQQTYLRSLSTLPNVTIIRSHFRSESVYMPLSPWIYDLNGVPETVRVIRMKEKGSDVNLATQLLIDAYENNCSHQYVLSADSDLQAPISTIKERLGRNIGLILPTERNSKKLKLAAGSSVYHLKKSTLEKSQFPNSFGDEHGIIHKPNGW